MHEPHFGQICNRMFDFYPGLSRVIRMTHAPTWNRSYSGGMRNKRITTVEKKIIIDNDRSFVIGTEIEIVLFQLRTEKQSQQ